MNFKYKKFTDVKKIPNSLVKAFLYSFQIETPELLKEKTPSELKNLLLQSELERRPGRGFCVVLALDDSPNSTYFSKTDFEKSTSIAAKAVELPKKFQKKLEFPYRCLVISLKLLEKFVNSSFDFSAPYIKSAFTLSQSPEKSYELFCPLYLITQNFFEITANGLKKLKPLTETLYTSVFNTEVETEPESPQQPLVLEPQQVDQETQQVGQKSQQVTTESQQVTEIMSEAHSVNSQLSGIQNLPLNMLNVENMSRKGFKENTQFNLKNIWNPDKATESSSYDEIAKILRYCKKRSQFQSDEALILGFLSQNQQQILILELTHEQQTNLEQFLLWLKAFRREERWQIIAKFQRLKQGEYCFKSFANKLKKLYKEAHQVESDSDLTDFQNEEIKRVFVKNLGDKRIRPQIRPFLDQYNLEKLVTLCENILADLNDEDSEDEGPVTAKVNAVSAEGDQIIRVLQTFKNDLKNDMESQIKTIRAEVENVKLQNEPKRSQHFSNNHGPSHAGYRNDFRSNGYSGPGPRYNNGYRYHGGPRYSNSDPFCGKCRINTHATAQCERAHAEEFIMGRQFCRFCKRLGHTVRNCFKAAEKDRRNEFSRGTRGHVANVATNEISARDIFTEN